MPYWTLSPIYFDPTGTLLSRRSIPSYSSYQALSLSGVKERKREMSIEKLVTAIAIMHNVIGLEKRRLYQFDNTDGVDQKLFLLLFLLLSLGLVGLGLQIGWS
jgi:hypothetical protein